METHRARDTVAAPSHLDADRRALPRPPRIDRPTTSMYRVDVDPPKHAVRTDHARRPTPVPFPAPFPKLQPESRCSHVASHFPSPALSLSGQSRRSAFRRGSHRGRAHDGRSIDLRGGRRHLQRAHRQIEAFHRHHVQAEERARPRSETRHTAIPAAALQHRGRALRHGRRDQRRRPRRGHPRANHRRTRATHRRHQGQGPGHARAQGRRRRRGASQAPARG